MAGDTTPAINELLISAFLSSCSVTQHAGGIRTPLSGLICTAKAEIFSLLRKALRHRLALGSDVCRSINSRRVMKQIVLLGFGKNGEVSP